MVGVRAVFVILAVGGATASAAVAHQYDLRVRATGASSWQDVSVQRGLDWGPVRRSSRPMPVGTATLPGRGSVNVSCHGIPLQCQGATAAGDVVAMDAEVGDDCVCGPGMNEPCSPEANCIGAPAPAPAPK